MSIVVDFNLNFFKSKINLVFDFDDILEILLNNVAVAIARKDDCFTSRTAFHLNFFGIFMLVHSHPVIHSLDFNAVLAFFQIYKPEFKI